MIVHQAVQEVWDHYLEQRRAAGRRMSPPKLTDKRRRQIAARLMTFGKDAVLRAVRILWTVPYHANTPEEVFGSDVKVGILLNQPAPVEYTQELKACTNEAMLDRVLDCAGVEVRTPARREVGNVVFEADGSGVRVTATWYFEDEDALRAHLALLGIGEPTHE
jgi:hypothetical protein